MTLDRQQAEAAANAVMAEALDVQSHAGHTRAGRAARATATRRAAAGAALGIAAGAIAGSLVTGSIGTWPLFGACIGFAVGQQLQRHRR